MKKKVTMQAIADELDISKSLVSKALANLQGVSDETKELVRRTAIRMGYRAVPALRTNRIGKTGNVAVLLPRDDLKDSDYWGKIIHGIEEELSRLQFSMIVAGIDTLVSIEDGMPHCISERKVDGVVIMGQIPYPYVQAINAANITAVLVDSTQGRIKLDLVMAENYGGAYEATSYLLDRGHRKIGFVGDLSYAASFNERYRGFKAAAQDYRRDRPDEEIRMFECTGSREGKVIPFSVPEFEAMIVQEEKPTAIVCANDPIAFNLLQLLGKFNLSCPGDISLIGFDNVNKCNLFIPPLTSVDACKELMGRRAVEMLMRRVEDPEIRPEQVNIMTQIVERESVANK